MEMAVLSPLFSPSEPNFLESSHREPTLPTAPLFLQVTCTVQRHHGEKEREEEVEGEGVREGEGEGEEEGEGVRLHTQPHSIPVCLSEFCGH